jgi:hypothetical protein
MLAPGEAAPVLGAVEAAGDAVPPEEPHAAATNAAARTSGPTRFEVKSMCVSSWVGARRHPRPPSIARDGPIVGLGRQPAVADWLRAH